MAEPQGEEREALTRRRDEIRATRTELKAEIAGVKGEIAGVKGEIVGTNERLDSTNARLEAVEHTLADLASQQVLSIRYMKNTFGRHGDELEELDDRVTTLEDDPKRSGS